ncbi:unnamed protein product [Protopolystoma xenopodis]|uniref:Uncharacterized protein n=1 Tax=Protopolystoma xenopodis TaxID=117903 RepID=A0A3S5CV53_9PLAT|nr:unnamed protein product [Protopolystoma xenopodis]
MTGDMSEQTHHLLDPATQASTKISLSAKPDCLATYTDEVEFVLDNTASSSLADALPFSQETVRRLAEAPISQPKVQSPPLGLNLEVSSRFNRGQIVSSLVTEPNVPIFQAEEMVEGPYAPNPSRTSQLKNRSARQEPENYIPIRSSASSPPLLGYSQSSGRLHWRVQSANGEVKGVVPAVCVCILPYDPETKEVAKQ